MPNWNPFRAVSGIRQGIEIRKKFEETKRAKEGRQTVYYTIAAGREPAYRAALRDNMEQFRYIESFSDAIAALEKLNQGQLTSSELSSLRKLSPSEIVNRFPKIDPETLANLYHVVGAVQRLGRQRDTISDPLGALFQSQTEYYQSLPPTDRRHLRKNERWNSGDPTRPFNTEAFTRFRNQPRSR